MFLKVSPESEPFTTRVLLAHDVVLAATIIIVGE